MFEKKQIIITLCQILYLIFIVSVQFSVDEYFVHVKSIQKIWIAALQASITHDQKYLMIAEEKNNRRNARKKSRRKERKKKQKIDINIYSHDFWYQRLKVLDLENSKTNSQNHLTKQFGSWFITFVDN